jgi:PAS domain S-box-containing protein
MAKTKKQNTGERRMQSLIMQDALGELRRKIFLYGCAIGLLAMLIATPVQLLHDANPVLIVQDLVVLGSFASVVLFGYRAKNLVWYMRWIALIIFGSFVINVFTGTYGNVGIYWIFLFPMAIFTFFAAREALVWTAFFIVFILSLAMLSIGEPKLSSYNVTELWTAAAVLIILTVINFLRQRFTEQGRDALMKAERIALLQQEELRKFKLAADSAYDHIVITDPDGIVLYANDAASRITGFTPKEILGTKAGKKWSLPMPHIFYEKMWRTIKTQKRVFTGELQNKRKSGEVYDALASISPILNAYGDVEYFLGIERDITRVKQVDRAKTEFVSLASHQLRTPLSAINWYTEMLLNGDAGKVNAEQKEYLNEVYHGSQRMVALVNALLNVSRIDLGTFAIEPQPTKIQEIATIALKELKSQIEEKHIRMVSTVAKDIPVLPLDPKLALIILQNLLSNAVKYTPPKGMVTLRVFLDAKCLTIEVQDTGYGIAKQDQPRMFQKLFRADNVREKVPDGTGLGLYIVKSILQQSGGKISFTSELNKGTTFRAILPASGMKSKSGTKGLTA